MVRGSRSVANLLPRAFISPGPGLSRLARRTGVLVAGDAPPQGVRNTFLDYREALLPRDLKPIEQGEFPLGKSVHPQKGAAQACALSWAELNLHAAVIGPSGSGKTRNVLVPWLVAGTEVGLNVLAIDVRGDLLQEIKAQKQRWGTPPRQGLFYWDVTQTRNSRSWNPLGEVRTTQDASMFATALLGEPASLAGNDRFFADRDLRWLRGLVSVLVASSPQTPEVGQLFRLIVDQKSLGAAVRSVPGQAHELLDLISFPPAEYHRATSGLANKLSWMADPALRATLSGTGARSFSFDTYFSTPGALLVVGARLSDGERSLAAASIIINLLRMRALERFSNHGPSTLWILDEVPKYASRIQLDQLLDVIRGAGGSVVMGLQDVSQFGTEVEWSRQLANCSTVIAMKGVRPSSVSYVSKLLGRRQAPTTTESRDWQGKISSTMSFADLPVLGDREIAEPPVGRYGAIVHSSTLSPYPWLVSFNQ
ncbi:Type IV secretion-system coupling protein DNA-binding domain-containing protein [Nocardioides alpinus]|uniref:Type IV secretion-system coupling protein DNA-binding domain-containing protein n=1 Tax=Nocardioides alpinus TaxID=748909 RepID=A0A1I1B2P3_9ACTN|nr:type IV secretion system DNA-binding domain-containing protein [Nocardioides alpinus]PKH40153.1 hypothetical protein CXG46_13425 [Nocardioides alpinus]SFB44614.1 Type IV secretion-system coupling protein DNA-binding domain-containing protein [Nocardioides alpinus]